MADGCTKLGREGAGTFQCPRPLCIGRNLTYPVPWHLSMPWVGPWLRRCRPTFAVCLPSVPWGLSRARPAALKGSTGRKGKIPTYVKRSRALKSARSFSPKFRAAVCHLFARCAFSPQTRTTHRPTSCGPLVHHVVSDRRRPHGKRCPTLRWLDRLETAPKKPIAWHFE